MATRRSRPASTPFSVAGQPVPNRRRLSWLPSTSLLHPHPTQELCGRLRQTPRASHCQLPQVIGVSSSCSCSGQAAYTRSSVPVISRPACVAPRSSVPFWRNSELSDRNGLRVNRESSTNGSTGCGSTQSSACSSATRASSSATRNQECLHQGLRQHSPRPPARASRSR